MSGTQTHTVPETDLRRDIVEHLKERSDEGKVFFKSKSIARDLGVSSKKVGANLARISEGHPDVEVERWSQSNATTWKIEMR